MDVTTKAVALRATDYRENDKLLLLYSLEYGKITIHARGVRKSAAKLKFACDQFCFGSYELAQIGDRFTLKTCDQLASFYSLRQNIVAYYAACACAEALIVGTEERQSEPKVFVSFLKALEQLCQDVEPLLVTLKFLSDFLSLEGFKLDFSHCVACGKTSLRYWLDFSRGGVVCAKCRGTNAVVVSAAAVSALNSLEGVSYDELCNLTIPGSTLKEALNLLQTYFSYNFSPLKSLSELLKLV